MPLISYDAAAAIDQAKNNPVRNWPSRDSGENRIEPIAKPAFSAGAKLSQGDKVFTIGSCFARNVERALSARGFEIPAWKVLDSDAEFAKFGPNILNNYGVASIYNELAWALDAEKPFDAAQNFFQISENKYIDVHLNRGIRPVGLDVVAKRRDAICRMYREIADCPLIIITLGLAECWYDGATELYLNARPHHSMIAAEPDRYKLHVMDYNEVYGYLEASFSLIEAYRKPGARVLLTVSPVPLQSTYRDMDVVVANMYSKSVLRVAAEHVLAKFSFVDYFPSYESVVLTRRDIAWESDQTHVKSDIVDVNISRMIRAYTDFGEVDNAGGAIGRIVLAIKEHASPEVEEVFGAFEHRPDLVASDPMIAAAYCDACLELDKISSAAEAFGSIPGDWQPETRDFLQARLLFAQGEYTAALEICRKLLAHENSKNATRELYQLSLKAIIKTGDVEAGVRHITEWRRRMRTIKGSEPFRILALALAEAGDGARADIYFREALDASSKNPDRVMMDYCEFLTDQDRKDDAKRLVVGIKAENRAIAKRQSELFRRLGVG